MAWSSSIAIELAALPRRVARNFTRFGLRVFFYIPDALLWFCARRWRFRLARRFAQAAEFLPRHGWYGGDGSFPRWRLDGPRELAFYYVLCRMYRQHRRFEPLLNVTGADLLEDVTGGALLITGHFVLNALFFRWLSDRGRDVVAVTRRTHDNACQKLFGTDRRIEVIPADALTFVQMQRRLAEGKLVCYMPDAPGVADGEGVRPLQAPSGAFCVHDAPFRFAEKTGFPVFFWATRLTNSGEVQVTLTQPASDNDAARRLEEFVSFLSSQIRQVVP